MQNNQKQPETDFFWFLSLKSAVSVIKCNYSILQLKHMSDVLCVYGTNKIVCTREDMHRFHFSHSTTFSRQAAAVDGMGEGKKRRLTSNVFIIIMWTKYFDGCTRTVDVRSSAHVSHPFSTARRFSRLIFSRNRFGLQTHSIHRKSHANHALSLLTSATTPSAMPPPPPWWCSNPSIDHKLLG